MLTKATLLPAFALAAWTILVLIYLALARFTSGVRPVDFALGESARVPERTRLANRNYMNLLELPVLFYVCLLIQYVSEAETQNLAWVYVALRIAHTLIHLTYNNVMHRLAVFAASNFVLVAMWAFTYIQLN
jgi:hypothetical protein